MKITKHTVAVICYREYCGIKSFYYQAMITVFVFLMISCCAGCYLPKQSKVHLGKYKEQNHETAYNTFELEQYLDRHLSGADMVNKYDEDNIKQNVTNLMNDFGYSFSGYKIGEFSGPVINNKFNINKVKAYGISYTSTDVHPQDSLKLLSGAIIVPEMQIEKIRGVILFFHGTEVSKYRVPSMFNISNGGEYYAKLLAATFAVNGFIVVAPDFIGLGIDDKVIHPYIAFPEANASSCVYMLNAAKQFLSNKGIDLNKIKLDINNKIPLHLVGFSEGGSYALWASRMIQNVPGDKINNANLDQFVADLNFDLKNTIGIAGAYSLRNQQMQFEFADLKDGSPFGAEGVNEYNIANATAAVFAKPLLVGYALTSFAYYEANAQYPYFFNYDFFFNDEFHGVSCPKCNIERYYYDILPTANLSEFQSMLNKKYFFDGVYYLKKLNRYYQVYRDGKQNIQTYKEISINKDSKKVEVVLGKYHTRSLISQADMAILFPDIEDFAYRPIKYVFNLYQLLSSNNIVVNNLTAGELLTNAAISLDKKNGYGKLNEIGVSALNNQAGFFVNPAIENTPKFLELLENKSVHAWKTYKPVTIIYSELDSVVTNLNSKDAISKTSPSILSLSAKGMVDSMELKQGGPFGVTDIIRYSSYADLPSVGITPVPLDHINVMPFNFIQAINKLNCNQEKCT